MVKYVIGHKNPDSDCVISAILYSEFLNSLGIKATALALGELNFETKFILEHFGVSFPKVVDKLDNNSLVILVDHNEKKQTISNIDDLKIDSIIDHHKIDLKTSEPLFIRCEALGSTCSILYKIFLEQNFKISKLCASLLICGIVSDTLFFRSPTTTDFDKKAVFELNKIAKIEDVENFSLKMFDAKSNLGDILVEDMIKLDYKEFDFAGKKFGIGVMETTNKQFGLERKEQIFEALGKIKLDDNLSGILFSIVDILDEKNLTLVCSDFEAKVLVDAFDAVKVEKNIFDLGKVLSRKKQIVPVLEKFFN